MKSILTAVLVNTIMASSLAAQKAPVPPKPKSDTIEVGQGRTPDGTPVIHLPYTKPEPSASVVVIRPDSNTVKVFRDSAMKVDTASIPIESLRVLADTAWVTLRKDSATSFIYRFHRGKDGSWFKRDDVVARVIRNARP